MHDLRSALDGISYFLGLTFGSIATPYLYRYKERVASEDVENISPSPISILRAPLVRYVAQVEHLPVSSYCDGRFSSAEQPDPNQIRGPRKRHRGSRLTNCATGRYRDVLARRHQRNVDRARRARCKRCRHNSSNHTRDRHHPRGRGGKTIYTSPQVVEPSLLRRRMKRALTSNYCEDSYICSLCFVGLG